jgi:predicted Zn-dependent protease
VDRTTARRVERVAGQELARAMREMRLPGSPRPYYIAYLIRDEERWRLQARYGAIVFDRHERQRNALVDVRVGSHRFDQVRDGGLNDNDKEHESYEYVELPIGANPDALRHGLWRLTDARYREAVESLLSKKSHELTYVNSHRHLQAFERREPITARDWRPFPEVDREHWARVVERASAMIRRYPEIKSGHVDFEVDHQCRIFVNTEGSHLVQCQPIWSLECGLWMLTPRGDGLPWTFKRTVSDPAELPGEAELQREIRAGVARLRRLARAPTLRSFSGPALLDPVPAGLLIHEAMGHRLEGTRLLATGEAHTFRDSLGDRVLPEFLTVRDDPTLERYGGRSLIGHYRFDDEGVPAQDTKLVAWGRLERFLTTRVGVQRGHHSSGHARSSYHERPISRMGVTIVEGEGGLDDRRLKQVLLEEIRRQKAPFGIRVIEATSGETVTDSYNFQAFLGEVNLAAKVFPDGREEWVRGVNFVGTPLNAVRSIVAVGRRAEVDNSFCGAESGFLPVSTVSPALVVSELELQSKAESSYTPYSYRLPWERRR